MTRTEVRSPNRTKVPMSAKDTCIKNDMHSQMLCDADTGQGAFKTVHLDAMPFAHGGEDPRDGRLASPPYSSAALSASSSSSPASAPAAFFACTHSRALARITRGEGRVRASSEARVSS